MNIVIIPIQLDDIKCLLIKQPLTAFNNLKRHYCVILRFDLNLCLSNVCEMSQ